MRGDRAAISGHAIEVRVLAEDPSQGFRPSAGKILAWASQERPGVRIDAGFEAGREIPPYYDSLLAKVIAHAPTRPAAILKMVAALEELHILGVATNIGFALDVLADPQFRRGDVDTAYLPEFIERWSPSPPPEELASILAFRTAGTLGRAERERPSTNPAWNHLDSFRIGRLPVGGQ